MAGSLNKWCGIGNVGKDPEIRSLQSGDKVANLSLACTESWRDKQSGDKREKTTWVPIVVFGRLAETVERYVKKGDKLYIEGAFSVRKWQDREGTDRYSTEIVLQGFGGTLLMLGSPNGGGSHSSNQGNQSQQQSQGQQSYDLDDDIPF